MTPAQAAYVAEVTEASGCEIRVHDTAYGSVIIEGGEHTGPNRRWRAVGFAEVLPDGSRGRAAGC